MSEGREPADWHSSTTHRKLIHDYQFMLSNLKQINPHQCRECGMRFINPQQHSQHSDNHFNQRLAQLNNSTPSHTILTDPLEWVVSGEIDYGFNEFCLTLDEDEVENRVCVACGGEIDVAMRDNMWAYINATGVEVHGQRAMMHKSCQATLTQ